MIPIALVVVLMLAAPPLVDTMADQQPDSPLYAVEQIGEQMELAAGMTTHSALAKERINEYAYMAQKGKDDTKLLTDATNDLNIARQHSESMVKEATSYRGAILKAVSESASVPKISRDRVKALLKTYSESGYFIGEGGVPMPSEAPTGCWWEPYPIDGNIMEDIYTVNSNNVNPPVGIMSATPNPTILPINPPQYTVREWKTVGGEIWRMVCDESAGIGIGPAPHRPPIDM